MSRMELNRHVVVIFSNVGDITALLHFAFWVVIIVFLFQKSDQVANKYGEPVDH